jgi:hypothetical protein
MLSAKIVAQNPGGNRSPASFRTQAGASITTAARSADEPVFPALAAVHEERPKKVREIKQRRFIGGPVRLV